MNDKAIAGIEMNDRLLAELSARLAALAASNPARDLEKNFRGMLSSTFANRFDSSWSSPSATGTLDAAARTVRPPPC